MKQDATTHRKPLRCKESPRPTPSLCQEIWVPGPPFHVSPTPNQHEAIDAIELALAAYQEMFGHPLADLSPIDEATGETKTVLTIVTDNVAPFRSLRFQAFITAHPNCTTSAPG